MCEKKRDLTPPSSTGGDLAHTAVSAGLGALPVVGSGAAALFEWLLAAPLERRRQEWMESVADGLRALESSGLSLESLHENEQFISAVTQASYSALRTASAEKREALKNAVLNSTLPGAPESSLQEIFIRLVDELTEWHLRLLDLFSDPPAWFKRNGRRPPEAYIAGAAVIVLEAAYPELAPRREFYDLLGSELHAQGLLTSSGFHTTTTSEGMMASRTTQMGSEFLAYVRAPQ